ncbi:hypothetical protein L1987_13791 [Smallanthus sonchifolius]|uniref:Uncharacterized protein n=1 Tax=Smallanthus sonchifolius TaxID=185202 RepID=A0ACB9JHF3_9ASTR|nr:hypothetical protein L1987_13791 [Smallanthus sonchifolius]
MLAWVWRVDEESKTQLPKEDIGKFYSGDCYICLYSYHSNSKNDHYLCCWIGKESIEGGFSSGYKSYIADKGLNDETYSPETSALIEVSGTSIHNTKALQVVVAATSLNSYRCFILQSASSVSTWYGNQSTIEEVYNCEQDDLLTEHVMILDTHAEVMVWVGQTVDLKEKRKCF